LTARRHRLCSPRLRFSVVIPCFNQGVFLGECLDSLSRQTEPPAEIIIVDDGSNDPFTIDRIDALGRGHRVVRQENRGLPAARNAGVDVATGDFIVPLDADDELTPDALATYAEAIGRERDVAIWYPDIELFGLEQGIHPLPPFNPWRLLWDNRLVCSSAIRRDVFASVRYNERMRAGYEDWEFYVHACCERGFRAERLRRPVFRYRRWGFSMLLGSDRRRPAIIEQLQAERPIFRDDAALLALKRAGAPHVAIAAQGPTLASHLQKQSLPDFQIVDASDAVGRSQSLAVVQPAEAARVLVSIDDAALGAAFERDGWLLEKIARAAATMGPPLAWLVVTPGRAYLPGELTSAPPASDGRVVGFVLKPRAFVQRRAIPASPAGLLPDLASWARLGGAPAAWLVVGQDEVARNAGIGIEELILEAPPPRDRLAEAGRRASQVARRLIGPERHDALWQHPALRALQRSLDRATAWSDHEAAPSTQPLREGPLPLELEATSMADRELAFADPMRVAATHPGPRWLVVVEGNVDEPLLGFVARAARRRSGEAHVAARHLPPHARDRLLAFDSGFCLATFSESDAVVRVVERTRPSVLLLAGAGPTLEALPQIREAAPSLRVVCVAHAIGDARARVTRFYNLIDRWVVLDAGVAEELRALYVSPSRIETLASGDDARLAELANSYPTW
jgi:hypothetical protein